MPSPAGLMPIDDTSPPSEANAPAMPIERAVPNPKLTCESENMSFDIMPSWSIISPPNLYCAEAVPTMAADAMRSESFPIIFMLHTLLLRQLYFSM